jgi:uncharacterized membrane protein (DUF106 family)
MVHYTLDRERLQEFRQAMDRFAKEQAKAGRTPTSGNAKKTLVPVDPE